MRHLSVEEPASSLRWLMLGLASMTGALVVAAPTMALPVLFAEISAELQLSLVQVGTVWGLISLAGMFVGIAGGMLGDRVGTKRYLTIACLAAGVFGASRGLSDSLFVLSLTVFLSGLVTTTIPGTLHKVCANWFSKDQLGVANAVISGGMALGFVFGSLLSATVLSPWLGSWRNVFFFYGGVAVLLSLPWSLTRLSSVEHEHMSARHTAPSFFRTLTHVIRLRDVWVLGLGMLGVGGAFKGFLGYLPLYLRDIGWTAARADTALSSFHVASLLAVVPLAWLSDRLGSRKGFLVAFSLVAASGIGLLSIVDGIVIWMGVLLAGAVRDAFMSVIMTTGTEVKGVGATYTGTALGLAMTLLRIGGLVAPPLGNSLAVISPRLPFVLWGAMALMGLIVLRLGQGSIREEC